MSSGKLDRNLEELILRQLDDAQACLCESVPGIFDNQSTSDRLFQRIEEGMRVWLNVPNWRHLENSVSSGHPRALRLSEFLAKIGVEMTSVGIFDEATSFEHERTFSLQRSSYRAGFRDSQLFRGVEKIIFQQAHAIKLHGEAQSAAAIRPADFSIVDVRSDYFADWNEPDVSLISVTYVGANGGCVVSTSGLPTHDSYVGVLGHGFVGAEANHRLLQNLLEFLFQGEGSRRVIPELDVHRLIQSIERNLLELARGVLGANGEDWTQFVADNSQQKAKSRAEAEGSAIPWTAYLDLADHINTIAKCADRFQGLLKQLDLPTSKNKIKSEVFRSGELIRLRILDSHATKRLITDHDFTAQDLELLRSIDQRTIALLRLARPLSGLPMT